MEYYKTKKAMLMLNPFQEDLKMWEAIVKRMMFEVEGGIGDKL